MGKIITLTTDFGQSDYDTGVLAGVIWGIAPEARVIDLSHEIPRHAVLQAALMLGRCTSYFPDGTIHIVVVDPGVGTGRRGLAARLGGQWFVGPDNGLLTQMWQRAQAMQLPVEIVHLTNSRYWLDTVSAIFHGRDIFAPVAAHLATGVPLSALGPPVTDPVLIHIPQPERTPTGWQGTILHVDAFGNLSTNLERRHFPASRSVEIRLAEARIHGLVRTFGEGRMGELVALFDSSGMLSICLVNGSAASRLGVKIGDPLEALFDG
jgi:S-adenosylmethionine hydrolase